MLHEECGTRFWFVSEFKKNRCKAMLDNRPFVTWASFIISVKVSSFGSPRYVCLFRFFPSYLFISPHTPLLLFVIVFLRWVERVSIAKSIQMIMCIIIMSTTLYASIFLRLFDSVLFALSLSFFQSSLTTTTTTTIYLFISSACRILPFLQFC